MKAKDIQVGMQVNLQGKARRVVLVQVWNGRVDIFTPSSWGGNARWEMRHDDEVEVMESE